MVQAPTIYIGIFCWRGGWLGWNGLEGKINRCPWAPPRGAETKYEDPTKMWDGERLEAPSRGAPSALNNL